MITEATTTQDLIATIGNALSLSEGTFEEGCTVLDAIEMFDRRDAGRKLGTWLEYSGALRFVPVTDTWDDRPSFLCEKLAQDVVTWTCRQLDRADLARGDAFTAWVVIDRATHVAWVECSAVQNQRALHPRAIREASEFPSSSRGTVSATVFLHMGETWREVLDSVLEAFHEAKDLLDLFEGCDHNPDQDEAAARKLLLLG